MFELVLFFSEPMPSQNPTTKFGPDDCLFVLLNPEISNPVLTELKKKKYLRVK